MSAGKIKKDKTLIEDVIDNSKEIVKLKNTIHFLSETIVTTSKCNFRPPDRDSLTLLLKTYRAEVLRLLMRNAVLMKAYYSQEYLVIVDKFLFTAAEMQAGHAMLHKKPAIGEGCWVILFLCDIDNPFTDLVKAGDIIEYTKDLDKTHLPYCKPVWKPDHFTDLQLERIKLLSK